MDIETNFNFKSQPCTSREQSEKLLTLGLKKETVDMCWVLADEDREGNKYSVEYMSIGQGKYQLLHPDWYIPAWSLHRLIEMMPSQIKCRNGYDYANLSVNTELVQYRFYDTDYMHDECYEHFNDSNLYENICDAYEWLIKEGFFNKEYLV